MPAVMLSPHFTLEEFTASQTAAREGIPNVPDDVAYQNLKHTAAIMEKVRTILGGNPILISSGYRGPELNAAVGGSSTSAHCSGLAADWTCPMAGSPLEICHVLEKHLVALEIDQLIYEYDSWIHLGLSAGTPRHQTLTIDNGGTRTGLP
jgi:hypothetical protein